MSTIADLLIKVRADTDGATKDLDKVGKKGTSSLSKIGKVAGKAALGLGVTAGVGLAWAAKTGFAEFQEGEKVAAQTEAVLKSTGKSAGVTADHVGDLAGALLKKSGMDDEAIASGENLLLTFTNIRNEAGRGNDIFDQTTKTMVDMSVALGQDTKSSALQLGKALNDPIKGVTALQRVGVSFTAAQKKQIKTLVESGNTLGAQKLILRELNKEFGGSAEAAGKTFAGQISIARETVNNWLGDLVARAIPIIQQTIGWLRDHWPEISAAVLGAWASIQPALVAFGQLVATVAGLVQKHWGTIGPIVQNIADQVSTAFAIVTDILNVFSALLRGDWSAAWEAIKNLVSDVVEGIKLKIELFRDTIGAIAKKAGEKIKDGVVDGVTGIIGAVWGLITGIGEKIAGAVGTVEGWGKSVGSSVKSAAVGAVTGIAGDVWGVVSNVGDKIAEKASAIAGWGSDIGSKLKSGAISALSGIADAIVSAVKRGVNAVIGKINDLLEFSFTVDTHIPGVGKKSIGFNAPDIPPLATGARNFAGGMALVGEEGPELVNLPRGADVFTNSQSRRMMSGGGSMVQIEGDLVIREEVDIERAASRIGRRVALAVGG